MNKIITFMAITILMSLLPACEKLEPQPRRVPVPSDPGAWNWGCLGCGGGGGGGGGGGLVPFIIIKDSTFNPYVVTATKGATITWQNNDSYNHIITSTNNNLISTNIAGGGRFDLVTSTADTIRYKCTLHRETGTVIITP
ncbi:MAG TPA: hypothetical protein VMY77_08680 [Chitinophagaceae bacterium]|nr:hypothetical protein [Chitinophagaceae bacterium]